MTKIIDGKKVLTDASGAPLNAADRKPVADMSGEAIERRENVADTKTQMQNAMDAYVGKINPLLAGSKPQLLSEFWPLHNMVVCKPQQIQTATKSGIHFDPESLERQKQAINDAIGFKVVKVGPEVVNVKDGDTIFYGSAVRPQLIPLIDDVTGDFIVREYHCFAENWLVAVIREDAKAEDFKDSPIPDSEALSAKGGNK